MKVWISPALLIQWTEERCILYKSTDIPHQLFLTFNQDVLTQDYVETNNKNKSTSSEQQQL